MNVGTKSLLFGVHQFAWHPWTVARAWRSLYGSWPKWWEWISIVCHDLGYWGCTDMDGESGRPHPLKGADIAWNVTGWLVETKWKIKNPLRFYNDELYRFDAFKESVRMQYAAYNLAIGHSRYYAAQSGVSLSKLFKADKCCLLFDPKWFYLLRARLSGEINEYIKNAPRSESWSSGFSGSCRCSFCRSAWFDWYREKIKKLCASEAPIQEAAQSLGGCGPCARR